MTVMWLMLRSSTLKLINPFLSTGSIVFSMFTAKFRLDTCYG